MSGLITIAQLTFLDGKRRRIAYAAAAGGAVFLIVFAIAAHLVARRQLVSGVPAVLRTRLELQVLTLMGLNAANLLVVAAAIMLPLDTLSGEIGSGVIHTIASKPIRRADIVLGKALAHWLMLAAFAVAMFGGVVLAVRIETGFAQAHVLEGMALMWLEATLLLCIVIAGGVRLGTVSNGVVAFTFYAVAFIGGWVEQIGVLMGSVDARYVGTVISLASPVDAVWRRAMSALEPPVMTQVLLSPFASASSPSAAMIWWAAAFAIAALSLALVGFQRRAL